MCGYCERESLTEVQSANVHGQTQFWLADGTEIKIIGTAGKDTAVIVRKGSEGFGKVPHYAIQYSEQIPFADLLMEPPEPEIPAHLDGKYRIYIRPTADHMEQRDIGLNSQEAAERLARAGSRAGQADVAGHSIPFYVAVCDDQNTYPIAIYRDGEQLTGAAYELAITTPSKIQAA